MRKIKNPNIIIGTIFGILILISSITPIFFPTTFSGWTDYSDPKVLTALENFDENEEFSHFWASSYRANNSDSLHLIVSYSNPEFIQRVWITDGENFSSSSAGKCIYDYRDGWTEHRMEWHDGPKWSIGIHIDVVIKLQLKYGSVYLVSKHVGIDGPWIPFDGNIVINAL